MRTFDYSFLKTGIPGNITGLTTVIADLRAKEQFRKQQYTETFEEIRKKAMVASVTESNAIEGIVTTQERIREILSGKAPKTRDEKEIAGYRDALSLIHLEHENLEIDTSFLFRLHRMLVGDTAPEQAGVYKRTDNLIMEFAPDGTRRVRFTPVKSRQTKKATEQWLYAFYEARQDAEIPALLLIPCAILDFLCIHPFTDGNGRLSRLLTIQMLYDAGYDIAAFISVEAMINQYKDAYYESLRASSEGWHEGKNDYSPFLIFFMQILYRCFRNLDEHFMDISLKKAKKSERVEAIVMNAFAPVSKADIEEKLPDVSIKTIELALSRLQKAGKIKKIGTYRNARYMSESPYPSP